MEREPHRCAHTQDTGQTAPPALSALPRISRMTPKSCQEAGEAEEDPPLSLVDREPISGHLGPPAGRPADLVAPVCLQDTKPSSTPIVSSINLQHCRLAPECLDPHTLGLLWRQRELEIQALRCAIQNRGDARRGRILREVAGLPLERNSCSQEKLLQVEVQKLTVELKEQKKQAQLEKELVEEQLLQSRAALQQLEAELHALHKSCLLQLARSSWVGRVLRSSTGSVEVVTAETLMDLSSLSESDEAPPAQEDFRLEDVDWNSIAHRYPNLFTDIKSNLDHKHPGPWLSPELPPAQPPDKCGSELCRQHMERRIKSVEWSSLPLGGMSSSGGTDSDLSSSQLDMRFPVHVNGHPPQAPGHSPEQTESQARSFGRGSQAEPADLPKTHSDESGKTVLAPRSHADPDHPHPGLHWSPSQTSFCLKIVAVSRRKRFIRILNESQEETVDLGGFTLQQLSRHVPVRLYRFPPHTLLAPGHHVTVWGEGPDSTKKQPPSFLGQESVHFHSNRGCVTLLLSPKGEVLSEHQDPHCVTPVSRIFDDNTDLSIDRFPLSEARPGVNSREQRRRSRPPPHGRVRQARAGRLRPGWGPRVPRSPPPPQAPPRKNRPPTSAGPALTRSAPPHLVIQDPPSDPHFPRPRPRQHRPFPRRALAPTTPSPHQDAGPAATPERQQALPPARGASAASCERRDPHAGAPARGLPGRAGRQRLPSQGAQGSGERACAGDTGQTPPSVDRDRPMVALSVQSTAGSGFGFRFLRGPPLTADACGRL
ncbi:PREDICTED: lamin tail domain-containing protein 2 [Hipposideros armiger]|uniref:Lamin tail domain-containing protein 2 n=1 Tax=Hipposideros armiger TaxID=186990 RepID=A0A8B7QE64_HIPAR|nr:PREDICTED: lamin tail domain-containing protein 2 [Hipposideros armiger]